MDPVKKTKLKRRIKHYTPEIIVAVTVVAGAFALKYVINENNKIPTDYTMD